MTPHGRHEADIIAMYVQGRATNQQQPLRAPGRWGLHDHDVKMIRWDVIQATIIDQG